MSWLLAAYEEHNLANANANAARFTAMLATIDQLQLGVYSPVRGRADPAACRAAKRAGGWWGPWL